MVWTQAASQVVATTTAMGYAGFTLPSTPGVITWALNYVPTTPLQDNWARIGFYVPSCLVDGEVLAGPSFSYVSQPANGSPFYQNFDYGFLDRYSGLSARVSDYFVSIQLVPYCPPGLLRLMALV